jgi:sigma-E factor negative regulatory protein RseC
MYTEELYEEGIVKEAKDGIAIISIQNSDKCKECTAKIYCKPGNTTERSLTVIDSFGVNTGDKVGISIKGNKILSATFLLYGIPLILLLSGLFVGMRIFQINKELYSTLTAFGLVSIYVLITFYISKKRNHVTKSYPEIVFVSSYQSKN